ncbi:hypothetical protein [Luteolibacter sp. Populi]|uniref:hypothetical protein n=1 Tax=Luteolibacter sp. Populi TaxID=3230487 RepID=UPI0034676F27
MKPSYRRPKGFTRLEWLVVILILAALAALCAPTILKQKKAADRTKALSNIKQMGMMLFEFDNEYGKFPDDETAEEVKRRTKTDFKLTGQFSNDYFRQMLAGAGGKSEKPFWCKTAQSPKNADDNFSTPAKALEPGEVGYSYIMVSRTTGQRSKDEPSRPVIMTPSYNFQPDWTFDPEPYGGKAVILRLDNSATPMLIREDSWRVSTHSGKTLGDTGDNTPWGKDITPYLRAPQPRGGK